MTLATHQKTRSTIRSTVLTFLFKHARRFPQWFALGSLLALSLVSSQAQLVEVGDGSPGPVKAQHLTAELTALGPQIAAGGTLQAGLVLTLEEGWHVYWVNAGDSGEPPAVKWTLPAGITAAPMQFPPPSRLPLGPLMDYGYEDQVAYPILLTAASSARPGKVRLDAHVTWLVCAAQCFPGKAHLSLDVDIVPAAQAASLAKPALVGALGQAIKSLPAALPEAMHATAIGDTKQIALTLRTGGREEDAEFYPFNPEQIDDAADQQEESLPDGIRLVLNRSAYSTALPKTLHGLVKLSDSESYDLTVPVTPGVIAPVVAGRKSGAPAAAPDVTLVGELGLAFLGGLVLNLMPCVFPVLFLKGLALVNSSTEEKRRQRLHGLTYALGILVSFWTVVGALLVLRAGGRQVGWGFQMQSPGFVAVLATLVFFLGLSLAGQFELGLSLTSTGGELTQKHGFAGSFFTGVLATVVATPCMGPLLGAAVGFALSQPVALTFLIFTFLALGLALPYLLLTLQPQWTSILPRPGAWMEVLKQLTAVPLFATAIWLAWVYGQLYGTDGLNRMALLLLSFLVLAIAGWALGRWPARWGSMVAAILLIILALILPLRRPAIETQSWQPWSPENLMVARASGEPVFIDFTAAWCLSCKVNEAAVLRSAEIEHKFAKGHFKLLKADWTQYDPQITAELAGVNRSGVPTYIIYPAGKDSNADVLPELLTKDIVSSAIDRDMLLGTTRGAR